MWSAISKFAISFLSETVQSQIKLAVKAMIAIGVLALGIGSCQTSFHHSSIERQLIEEIRKNAEFERN